MPLDPVIQEIIKSLPPNDFETLTPEEFRIGNGDYSEGGGEDVDVIEVLVSEVQILKKICEWPRCVEISISKCEPHKISFYLYELVTLFHSYWNLGKENEEFRFITKVKTLNNNRLFLLQGL